MRKLITSLAAAVLLTISIAGGALANHSHDLITPGTTVVDIGSGQTARCASEPGGHAFHEHMHLGIPGTFAFGQAGQVTVVKTETASC
jgi:hypothetical protein